MAFIDFSGRFVPVDAHAPSTTSASEARPLAEDQPVFSHLELQVLALSRRDPASSIRPAGPVARKLAKLLGLRPTNPLADPRLEALRRFAVTVRCRGTKRAARLTAPLLALGFSGLQIATASSMVLGS